MKQKITSNDLIRFIYRETSATETMNITEAIAEDRYLYEEHQSLRGSYAKLPKAKFNPSKNTIQNILHYSENTAVQTQH